MYISKTWRSLEYSSRDADQRVSRSANGDKGQFGMKRTLARAFRTSEALTTRPATAAASYRSLFRSAVASRRVCRILPLGPTFSLARFHRSCQRSNSLSPSPELSSQTSFSDPERSDLYYHLVDPPTAVSASQPAFALSFLSMRPKTADSSAIIGWLPAVSGQGQGEAGLNDFKENGDHFGLASIAVRARLTLVYSKIPRSFA